MTAHKHLKQLVRARMVKTGERYSTARRHVVAQASSTSPKDATTLAGSVPAANALRLLLAHADVLDPHTKRPFTEAMLFGIGGGVGAGMFAFRYEKEDVSTFFVAGRHLWQDDEAWLRDTCARLGVDVVVKESGGAKQADAILREGLAKGPVIAWVDAASLPHRAMPKWMEGGGYHVVTVLAIDDAAKTVSIADLADAPIDVPIEAFSRSRARIAKQKNRVLWVAGGPKRVDVAKALRSGLAAGAAALAKGKQKNFTLAAFAEWADRLAATKGKEAWATMFWPAHLFAAGARWGHEFIEYYGTGGGLCRPLMAECLAEASSSLGDPALAKASEAYAQLGRDWSALADALLPDDLPAFSKIREALEWRAEAMAAGVPEEVAREHWAKVDALQAAVKQDRSLDAERAAKLRASLAERVRALHAAELKALSILGSA